MSYRTPEELARRRSKTGILPLDEAHAVKMEKEYQATMVRLECPRCGIWLETQREHLGYFGNEGMNCPNTLSYGGLGCRTFMEVRNTP
jgi:hypothetical protein